VGRVAVLKILMAAIKLAREAGYDYKIVDIFQER
jgi:hypothetical protein